MTGVLTTKPGVEFTIIAPGGFRILCALQNACTKLSVNLVLTSACDGCHSGQHDPHHRGEAYDVRSHDLDPLTIGSVLNVVMAELGFDRFYGFLEAPGTDNAHFHFQVRKGTIYP